MMGCRDIWEQSPALRNYEFWSYMCGMFKEDEKTYEPLIRAKERLERESKKKESR